MFIFRFFRESLKLGTTLKYTKEKLWKYILYFFILIIIANFPQSFEVIKYQGSKMDFLIEDFKTETPLNWNIPEEFTIIGGKLDTKGSTVEYSNTFKKYTYIINKQEKIKDPKDYLNHILLYESNIVYIDSKGNILEGIDYFGFSSEFSFKSLQLASGEEKTRMYQEFAFSMEKSFSKDIVLFTLLRNNIMQIVVNSLYVVILAGLVMLFKFAYQNFLSYKDSVKFVILSMTIPSLLSFGIGLLATPFAPVIFQLSSGMIVMLVVLIQGKKLFT